MHTDSDTVIHKHVRTYTTREKITDVREADV